MAQGSLEDLLEVARRVIDSRLFPVAVELLSPRLACEVETSDGKQCVLLIRFAGSLRAVAEQTTAAEELLKEKAGATRGQVIPNDTIVWNTLATLPLRFEKDLVWRVGLQPAEVGAFLAIYQGTAAAHGHEPIWQAGLGDGRIRVIDRLDQADSEAHETNKQISRVNSLSSTAQSMGANVIIEHASSEVAARLNTRATAGAAAKVMQRIKQQLDPEGIFPDLPNLLN